MVDDVIRRSEFVQYMEAFEERLNARVASQLDEKFNALDERVHALDGKLDIGLGILHAEVSSVHGEVDSLHAGLGSLEHRMNIQFEETRGLIRLSLEGLDALRETTERGFADVRHENQDNKTLLEAALKNVRRRAEKVEDAARPKHSP